MQHLAPGGLASAGCRYAPPMIIDVHAHAIPASFRSYVERQGADLGIGVIAGDRGPRLAYGDRVTVPLRDDLSDLDGRVAAMDRAGIDRQVTAGWIDLTGYELEGRAAIDYSRAHNDALMEEAARRPERFWTIGTIPLQDPAAAAAELERITDAGMKGAEIATTVRGERLHRAGLDAVWEVAADRGAFILLHPMTPLTGVDLSDYFMENMVGRPAETTITLAGLVLEGVFERFPTLRLCAVHGGGFAPFQIGRLDRGFAQKPGLVGASISKTPLEYLRSVYVDTVVHEPQVLRFLIDLLGADHILLGTDHPFEMGDDDPLATIRATPGITDDEVAAISGGNAAALLG